MTAAGPSRSTAPARDPPDGFFRLVVGLYTAALAAPAVLIAAGLGLDADPGFLYGALLAVVGSVVPGAAWAVGQLPGLPERLGRTPAVWGLVALPSGYLTPPIAGVLAGIDPTSILVLAGLLGAAAGGFVGIALVAMARNRYTRAVLESADETIRFRASLPARERRLVRGVGSVLILGGIVGLAADVALGIGIPGRWIVQSLPPLGAVLFASTGARRIVVTSVGLVVERPAHRFVRPWNAFVAFAVRDDALVIRRQSRWRPDIYCDRTDIDAFDSVVDALSATLPRAGHAAPR